MSGRNPRSRMLKVLLFFIVFISQVFVGATEQLDWVSERFDEKNTSYYPEHSSKIDTILWTQYAGDIVVARPIAVNGIVYVTSMDGKVYAISTELGSKIWETQVALPFTWAAINPVGGIIASPVYSKGKLYVLIRDGAIFSLDAYTGKILWKYELENETAITPTLVDDRYLIFFDDTGRIYIFDVEKREIVKTYHFREYIWAKAAYDGKRYVYIGTYRGRIIKLDKTTWNITKMVFNLTMIRGGVVGALVYSEGRIYFTTSESFVYALDENLNLVWSVKLRGPALGGPAVSETFVFVASADTYVYCIDKDTGDIIWSTALNHESSSTIAVSKNYVYLVDDYGYIYCIDKKTGTIIWNRAEFAGARFEYWKISAGLNLIKGLSGPIIYGKNIYVGLLDKRIVSIGEGGGISISPLMLYSSIVMALALIFIAGMQRGKKRK